MPCERCGGLMVVEAFCDLLEEESRRGIDTMRCLNCGNFEDRIIRTNRTSSRLSGHGEPHITGTRRQSASQVCSFEQTIQMKPISAEYPRGRTPRFPIGTSSAKIRTHEPRQSKQLTSMVQHKRKYA